MAATYRTSAAGGASSGTGNRTATITPAVGDLFVVYCYVANNSNDTPTCSDNNSGTYTRIDTANCVTSGTNYRLSVFVRDQLLTNTTSTVVTVATGSNSSGVVHVHAWSGMLRTGSNAVRSKGLQDNQAAGTAAPTLNQAALTGNPTSVAQGSADTTTTPPTNWTERQDTNQSNDTCALETATRDSGFTGTTITFGAASSTTFCSHALELDSSPPTFTGSATITRGALTASGTATFTTLHTGSAAVSHAALTAAGSGTFSAVVSASAAVTHGALTASGSGATSAPHPVGILTQFRAGLFGQRYGDFSGKPNTPPYSEGAAAVTHGALTCAGSATFSYPHPVGVLTQFRAGLFGQRYGSFGGKGGSDSAGAVTLGAKVAAGSATFTAPVYSGTGAVSLGAKTVAGTALFVAPVYDGTGLATHGALTASGSATFTAPVYTGSGAVTHAALTASGTGLFAAVVYVGAGAVSLAAKVAAGTATFTAPAYTGSATITRGPLTASGTAFFFAPVYDGVADLTLGAKTVAGVATTDESVDLLADLEGYYRFEDDLTDSSGNGRDLTDPAATFDPSGILGVCLASGSPTWVGGPVAAGGLTLQVWVDATGGSTDPAEIAGAGPFTISDTGGGGIVRFETDQDSADVVLSVLVTWHQCVLTTDGDSGVATVYVDGVAVTTLACGVGPYSLTEWSGGAMATWFAADEMAVWSRAMNAAEVAAMWNDGDGFDPTADVGVPGVPGGVFRRGNDVARVFRRGNDTSRVFRRG